MAYNDFRGGGHGNGGYNSGEHKTFVQKTQPAAPAPSPVKIESFYNADGTVKIDLFDKTAESAAKTLGSKEA